MWGCFYFKVVKFINIKYEENKIYEDFLFFVNSLVEII